MILEIQQGLAAAVREAARGAFGIEIAFVRRVVGAFWEAAD